MKANFAASVEKVFELEGGFTDDPNDNGGRTNLGITQKNFDAWRDSQGQVHGDVAQISRDEASAIYKAQYWDVDCCDDLPNGLDFAVFQAGVNLGTGTAAKLLQTVLGVTVDGGIGPETLAAVATMNLATLTASFLAAQQDRYSSIVANHPNQAAFLDGWMNRVTEAADFIGENWQTAATVSIGFFVVAALIALAIWAATTSGGNKWTAGVLSKT